MSYPYPLPVVPDDMLYDQWCIIGTAESSREYTPEGTPVQKRFYPYGEENGKHKRVRCCAVIMYQNIANPNGMRPADENYVIPRQVNIYTPVPNKEIQRAMYPHRSWLIRVFDTETSTQYTEYICTGRAGIYDQHVEYHCVPK